MAGFVTEIYLFSIQNGEFYSRMKDDLETSFSFWYWEEDTFTNGNFPDQCKYPSQKGNFCSIFTVSPMSISKKKKKKKIS